jgi:hypothetical protein
MDEAEQNVLSTDVVVIQHAGFVLSQHHYSACSVGKPFKHEISLLIMRLKPIALT